ncbi:DegT/DnrJ/EryC1/StrS family aminotransferase [Chitinophaga nivalis]|uniref:DegT/DnrJ/EryC1/StrS family aminotransferase n=1 Tax=Chitinophaga nivalis TaxID=2991709 RepID=A0ABT3IMY9_9BACT|nr:DegT/DnrJ/EryC1/StrS family aminotransferase [Chitinophaga nivalis]MCW3464964.1 DegT/DnrJ/EryC1/StrS family aminotransferase [Chitinophaga nivalis]MCW3485344.1 DegT/DnrJ/EryC1/StrS family aminotransferase [Chitinophaga nivalis]
MDFQMEQLAINGGKPVRQQAWPVWPASTTGLEEEVIRCLRSRRWTVSGFYQDEPSYEEKFARAFAAFNNVSYCIPTANGTSALLCGLQALGIGMDDEVIVPGLTWVACAVAVASLNAIPVLVDVDAATLCIDPEKVEQAITARTKAIMVVHLYSAVADMHALLRISEKYGIPIIEDCAQAHGATWEGKRVGTIGAVGTFSMQQGKILTSGEGGAVITNNQVLAEKIYSIRTNARKKVAVRPLPGYMELEDAGDSFASNYCLSEIACAILLNKLKTLEEENERRSSNRRLLGQLLETVEGVSMISSAPGTTSISTYHLPLRIELAAFGNITIKTLCEMLSAELGMWIHQPYIPLNKHPLYVTDDHRLSFYKEKLDTAKYQLPVCWKVYHSHLLLHHAMLLGNEKDMYDIVTSIQKIKTIVE